MAFKNCLFSSSYTTVRRRVPQIPLGLKYIPTCVETCVSRNLDGNGRKKDSKHFNTGCFSPFWPFFGPFSPFFHNNSENFPKIFQIFDFMPILAGCNKKVQARSIMRKKCLSNPKTAICLPDPLFRDTVRWR